MKKILLIDRRESMADSLADLLKDYDCDTTVSTGDAVPGQFDSVLYAMWELDGRTGDRLREIRAAYPESRFVVYSSRFALEKYAHQIESVSAETLEVIKTPEQIAAAL